jgi:hypothetical protein
MAIWNEKAFSRSVLQRRDFDFTPTHTIDMMSPLQLARLCVPGMDRISQFGLNMEISNSSSPEDLWSAGGVYLWPTAASQWEIVSSSPLDTAAGTGARRVNFAGLNSSYDAMAAVNVSLAGTTPVAIPGGPYFRFLQMQINDAGSLRRNQGTITVRPAGGGSTLGTIPAGRGRDKASMYTVPAGRTLYITEIALILVQFTSPNANVHATIWTQRPGPSGFYELEASDLTCAASEPYTRIVLKTPVAMPQKTDISLRVLGVTGLTGGQSVAVAGAFHGIQIDETLYGG